MNEQTANEVKGLIQENQGTIIMNFGAPPYSGAPQPGGATPSDVPAPAPLESSTKIDFEESHLGQLLKKSQLKMSQKKIRQEIERDKKIRGLERSHQAEKVLIENLQNELQETRLELAQALLLLKKFSQRENFKGL